MNSGSLPSITKERKRTFAHKKRSGCYNCKKRHLKCDEEKPACQKCMKARFSCAYPTGLTPTTKAHEPKILVLAPKPVLRSRAAPGSSVPIFTPSIIHQPSSVRFKTAQEARYFRFFCTNVSVQLSGLFDLSLWNRLILQTSEEEESVRLGIIALGALQHSIDLKGKHNDRYLATFAPLDEHHHFAVEQYNKAIKIMRQTIWLRKHSLRTTLLNCLLAICFETSHGNDQSAVAQMDVGIRLLEDYISSKRISFSKSHRVQDEEGDIAATDLSLPNTVNNSTPPSFALESPAPHEIEDELVQAFTRLDTQANSFLDSRPLEYHMAMKAHGSDCIARMPVSFCSIDEARKYQELLGRRISHWISCIGGSDGAASECEVSHRTYLRNEYNVVLDDQEGSMISWDPFKSLEASVDVLMERQMHLDDLERWWKAYNPLRLKYQYQTDTREYLRTIHLRFRFIATRLVLSMALSTNQLSYDDHLDEFRELLCLAKILYSHPSAQGPLSFDLGCISHLYTIASKCRDRHIRREAAQLLLSKPWREGLWESNVTGRISAAVIDIEEEGLQGEFVPNEARMRSMRMKFDLQSRELRLSCLMGGGDIKERTIRW